MKTTLCLLACCISYLLQAQCGFKRILTDRYYGLYTGRVIELPNKKVVYLSNIERNLNSSDSTEIGLYVTDSCGKVLLDTVVNYDTGSEDLLDAILTTDTNLLLATYVNGYHFGRFGVTGLIKVNPNTGEILWKKAHLTNYNSLPLSITYNAFKNTYLVTAANGVDNNHLLLLEVDSVGNELHRLVYKHNKNSSEFKYAYALNDSENVAVGAYLPGLNDSVVFLIKTNALLQPKDTLYPFIKNYRISGPSFNTMACLAKNQHLFILVNGYTYDYLSGGNWLFGFNRYLELTTTKKVGDGDSGAVFNYAHLNTTSDGGLLLAPGMVKLDSNLKTVFFDRYLDYNKKQIGLYHTAQLTDGSYAGIGYQYVKDVQMKHWPVFIRTATNGLSVGIPNINQPANTNTITLYPNPSKGLINLSGVSSGSMAVYNTLGKLVFKAGFNGTQVQLPTLPSGLYVVHMYNQQGNLILQTKHYILN